MWLLRCLLQRGFSQLLRSHIKELTSICKVKKKCDDTSGSSAAEPRSLVMVLPNDQNLEQVLGLIPCHRNRPEDEREEGSHFAAPEHVGDQGLGYAPLLT